MNISTDFKRMNAFFFWIQKTHKIAGQMALLNTSRTAENVRNCNSAIIKLILLERRTEHEINRVLVLHTHFSHVIIDKVKLFVKMHSERRRRRGKIGPIQKELGEEVWFFFIHLKIQRRNASKKNFFLQPNLANRQHLACHLTHLELIIFFFL